jgi:hypothetical protein
MAGWKSSSGVAAAYQDANPKLKRASDRHIGFSPRTQ